jgi:hypothetical protein
MAVLCVVILLVSGVGAFLGVRTGFADHVIFTARAVLLLGAIAVIIGLIILPRRRIDRATAAHVESRTPAFAGRVETYLGLSNKTNPLRSLLAQDAAEVAAHFPVERQIRPQAFTLPAAATAVSLGALLWLAVAGPGLLNYGVRHLWAGWIGLDLLPPQSIAVSPGDEAVRRGGALTVRALMEGFDPNSANIHARMGEGEWQLVDMARTGEGFEFGFFSVREPFSYYVSAAGIRSPAYQVSVVDLPNVERFRLTYQYPEWTQRPNEIVDPGGDIRVITGTRVELELVTETPLAAGELVLNGQPSTLVSEGNTARTGFQISQDGEYFVAARVGGEQIRLTDDFFIKLVADEKPAIELVRPGRDWNASSIEEVTARVDARDDFGLASLELRYAVNGGEWQSLPLAVDGRETVVDHVFMLENMGQAEGAAPALVPGDLIAYYAMGADRNKTARTDMYFIEVQPFDRRFTQSQQMGGGGGGGGQGEQEISKRQKEILVSTWNLLREQTETPDADANGVRDNATLLSELQTTLAEQAETLARRTRARELVFADEKIASFVENLEQAAAAMGPASERLAAIDLEQAIQPEQEALQHLLRAEAAFTDIQLSFQRGARGGGMQAGRDLAEMFELEMDLEKNQYETGSPASAETQSAEVDETVRQLEQLARRQERLAGSLQSQQQATPAQRWQQELLRREAQELKRRLDEMQQRMASAGQPGQQSGGQQGQQSPQQARQQGGQHGGQQAGQPGTGQGSEIARRMESAIRAMDEAAAGMQGRADPESLERAAREAQRQLRGVRDQVVEEQQQALQAALADMNQRAGELYDAQRRVERELDEAVVQALADSDRRSSGLSQTQESELAQAKRDLQTDLQSLDQDIQTTAQRYRDVEPGAAGALNEAARGLREAEVESRLAVAAEYIEWGSAAYIVGSESAVTRALAELKDDLSRAEGMAGGSPVSDSDPLADVLAQTRGLRRELSRLAGGDTSQQQPLRFGEIEEYGEGLKADDPQAAARAQSQVESELDATAQAARGLIPSLRIAGVTYEEVDEIRRLTAQLEMARFQGNPELVEREYLKALQLLEQLELRLADGARRNDTGTVRTAVAEPVPSNYKDAVADYYRRLSRDEQPDQRP